MERRKQRNEKEMRCGAGGAQRVDSAEQGREERARAGKEASTYECDRGKRALPIRYTRMRVGMCAHVLMYCLYRYSARVHLQAICHHEGRAVRAVSSESFRPHARRRSQNLHLHKQRTPP